MPITKFVVFAAFACSLSAAEKLSVPQLLELSRKPDNAAFAESLRATLGDAAIRKGTAVAGQGADFIWAVESDQKPEIFIDDQPAVNMQRAGKSSLWFHTGKLRTGAAHGFFYKVNGTTMGGSHDVAAYGPESYSMPGVPQGKLSEKMVHTGKIYESMKSDYWVYVPAQYDGTQPAALMVWQDGRGLTDRNGNTHAQTVFDNLTAEKKIPVMIHVLIDPGMIGEKRMRSIEYDTVSDKYPRFLRDEILPEVEAKYKIRKDGYSRAIAGNSSGGICAFNAAWWQPDQFSRVLSRIGSFTALQLNHPAEFDGGNTYPFRIRKEDKRNIRAWLQDGAEDLENPFGSWPLQNLEMANSLKFRDYDFHLSFGTGTHNGAHGSAELPEEMTWLWRDYDPAKTEQIYQMDPAEKTKPFYRVKSLNR